MRKFLAAVLGSMVVVACGGGGSDAGNPPPAATPLTITAANQDGVARATAAAAASMLGTGSGATASERPSPASAGMGVARSASLGDVVRRAAHLLGGTDSPARKQLAAAGAAKARPLAIPPDTEPCTVSGSSTLSFVDADNNGVLSVGDTMTLSYSQCRETASDLANGSLSITLSRVELVNGLLNFAGSMSIPQFTLTEGARSASLAGSLSMSFVQDSATQQRVTLVVGSTGLSAGVSGAGLNETITYEPGFLLSETDTLNATTGELVFSTATLGGGFSASSIGGRVLLEPVVPVVQYAVDLYPRSGTLRVVGSASALRLTALDATTVRVELDANLDGNYEASKDLAWSVLLPG